MTPCCVTWPPFFFGPLAGEALGSTLGGVAVGAAAGSAAGQLAGDALGTHQGFSFGEVFTAAATAVVTAGVANYLQTGSVDPALSAGTSAGSSAAQATGWAAFGENAAQSGAGYVAQNAAGKLVGQKEHFSWAGLVSSSLAGGVAGTVGPTQAQLQAGQAGTSTLRTGAASLVEGTVQRETSRALGDNHVASWESIGENAVGSGLGNYAGLALRPRTPASSTDAMTSVSTVGGSANGINPQNALEVRQDIAAEDMKRYAALTTYGSAIDSFTIADAAYGANDMPNGSNLPDAMLSDTSLTPGELARLATTTSYSGTYVDTPLIERNNGNASYSYNVQTFSLADEHPASMVDMTPAAQEAAPLYDEGTRVAARIAGATFGLVEFGVNTVKGTLHLAAGLGSSLLNQGVGRGGVSEQYFGYHTDTFEDAANGLGATVAAGVNFFTQDPGAKVGEYLSGVGDRLQAAAALSTSDNIEDQINAGRLASGTIAEVGSLVDGAVGVAKVGVAATRLAGDTAGTLAAEAGAGLFASGPDLVARVDAAVAQSGRSIGFDRAGGAEGIGSAPVVRDTVPNSAESASGVNPAATLRDYLGELDQNTMVHLTSAPQEAFEKGIDPGTFFARYGDVAHLTPQQYRIGVVGPVAGGYGPEANLFVTVSPANSEEFFTPWESAFGYVEWQNPSKVMPDRLFSVPSGPQLPYPETAIPPPPSPHR